MKKKKKYRKDNNKYNNDKKLCIKIKFIISNTYI